MAKTGSSGWNWFPVASLTALGVVVAVNGGLIFAALHSFPGETLQGGFEASNNYEQVLDNAAEQNALGWLVTAKVDGDHLLLQVTGKDGQKMPNAFITAHARRPLGPPMTTELSFEAKSDTLWRAEEALPQGGQWDVTVVVQNSGEKASLTRRVKVQ